jgi:hypothetical protein
VGWKDSASIGQPPPYKFRFKSCSFIKGIYSVPLEKVRSERADAIVKLNDQKVKDKTNSQSQKRLP